MGKKCQGRAFRQHNKFQDRNTVLDSQEKADINTVGILSTCEYAQRVASCIGYKSLPVQILSYTLSDLDQVVSHVSGGKLDAIIIESEYLMSMDQFQIDYLNQALEERECLGVYESAPNGVLRIHRNNLVAGSTGDYCEAVDYLKRIF